MPKKGKGSAKSAKAEAKGAKAEAKGAEAAEEEEWVAVQKRTFTNWVNYRLEGSECHVTDLATDLGNGVILIKLLEALSHKKLPGK